MFHGVNIKYAISVLAWFGVVLCKNRCFKTPHTYPVWWLGVVVPRRLWGWKLLDIHPMRWLLRFAGHGGPAGMWLLPGTVHALHIQPYGLYTTIVLRGPRRTIFGIRGFQALDYNPARISQPWLYPRPLNPNQPYRHAMVLVGLSFTNHHNGAVFHVEHRGSGVWFDNPYGDHAGSSRLVFPLPYW